MKIFLKDFLKRGLIAFGFGPMVMAIIYLCLEWAGIKDSITLGEIGKQVLLVSVMAFLASGITAVYQIEKLPLPFAIVIQMTVLYIDYIGVYLMNGWLKIAFLPIAIFTAIFIVSYAVIWIIVYIFNKRGAKRLNEHLK